MKFKIKSSQDTFPDTSVTIYRNGRLTFTPSAAKNFKLTEESALLLGEDEDDKNPLVYLLKVVDKSNQDAFGLIWNKRNDYVFGDTRSLFAKDGLPFDKVTITFKVTQLRDGDGVIYKLDARDNEEARKHMRQ